MSELEFEIEIKQGFLAEAGQILDAAEDGLVSLRGAGHDTAILEDLFRQTHNLKGSARAVGFEEFGQLAHRIEDALTWVKNGSTPCDQNTCAVLLKGFRALRNFVVGLTADLAFRMDISAVETELSALHPAGTTVPSAPKTVTPGAPANGAPAQETPEAAHPEIAPAANAVPTATEQNSGISQQEATLRVAVQKLDELHNLVGEMMLRQIIVSEHMRRGTLDSPHAAETLESMEKLLDEISHTCLKLRMVPVAQLFKKMRRVVQDVADTLDKDVELILQGEHTDLDKMVVEVMGDPLTHILRNAVDHGIESKETRLKAGKPARARVLLSAEQKADQVLITVSDDGAGMDPEKLLHKAVKKGLISGDQKLTDTQAYALIFLPGFSTKENVTEFSGRGVGMDVVRKAINDLKGEINLKSQPGAGTTFEILLPLTLSIIPGLVLKIAEKKYVIPLNQVTETVDFSKHVVETSTGTGKMINLRGEVIPVFSLREILYPGLSSSTTRPGAGKLDQPGVVINHWGAKASFAVDELLYQQQIVVKGLPPEMAGIPGIVAGTILNDGEPGLILDLHQFIKPKEGNHAA